MFVCAFLISPNVAATVHVSAPAAGHADIPPTAAGLPAPSHPSHLPVQSSHLGLSATSGAPANPNHQQELQAKILSLFNSGSGVATGPRGPVSTQQPQPYSNLGPALTQSAPRQAMPGPPAAAQGFGPPTGRMPLASAHRAPITTSNINFDSPSVQKALDTLIQSGPSLTPLVNAAAAAAAAAAQQAAQRPAATMGQVQPMSTYPPHYWAAGNQFSRWTPRSLKMDTMLFSDFTTCLYSWMCGSSF